MPKKVRTDGEVRKHGAGRITYRLGKTGTTHQASVFLGIKTDGKQDMPKKTFQTEADAEAWIDRMAVDSRRGALTADRNKRIRTVLTEYMAHREAERVKGNLTENTLRMDRRINRKVAAVIQNTEVVNLTAKHVQDAITAIATTYGAGAAGREYVRPDRKRGVAPPTRATPSEGNRALKYITTVLNYAIAHDLVVKNVARQVKPFNLKATVSYDEDTAEPQLAWEPSQVGAFLKAAQQHDLYALYILALSYGPRIGELLALQWGDIDKNKLQLRILRTFTPPAPLGQPKHGSTRTLAITEGVLTVLRAHRATQQLERVRAGGKWVENDLVFPTINGRYIHPTSLRDTTNMLIGRAGVPSLKFHGLRHTAASAMIRAGDDVVLVAGILGHKHPSMTLDVYSHLFAEHRRSRARDVGELYGIQPHAPAPSHPAISPLN